MESNISEILVEIKEELVRSNYISASKGVAITDRIHNISNKIFSNSFDVYLKEIKNAINKSVFVLDKEKNSLIGVIERMEDNLKINKTQLKSDKKSNDSNKIFIVHGRNEQMLNQVDLFIRKIKLIPVILSNEPNRGYTIFEKFKEHSDVNMAIVLLSADDKGSLKDDKRRMKLRARQNVVFELGYFMGKLGEGRVIPIKEDVGNFENPSDIDGLLYIAYKEGWKIQVAKELNAAGYDINLNDIS